MRKYLAVAALSLSATVAYANTPNPPQSGLSESQQQSIDDWLDQAGEQVEDWWYANVGAVYGLTDPDSGKGGGGVVAAPELDPDGLMAALTLLSGGLAVIRGRRRNR